MSISAFGEIADELPDDLAAGERCYCEGKLRVSRWQKDGEKRSGLQVAASKLVVLDRIGRKGRRVQRKPVAESKTTEEAATISLQGTGPRRTNLPDDPIPF